MFAVRAVHPHGCGEHEARPRIDSPDQGSSPRVWGTLPPRLLIAVAVRFIPTGVGNTSRPLSSSLSIAVHPHGCGEHRRGRGWSRAVPGSSPRVWGTQSSSTKRFHWAVHPHGCGEHHHDKRSPDGWGGSSPRVWGTRPHMDDHVYHARFIPTGVGNTWPVIAARSFAAVHPHGCGEHSTLTSTYLDNRGSSPRVWGTLFGGYYYTNDGRFIPTGVGNTSARAPSSSEPPVHPHGCGEHSEARRFFIPFTPVHPHGCGEHVLGTPASKGTRGSSPRVWGTLSSTPHPRG